MAASDQDRTDAPADEDRWTDASPAAEQSWGDLTHSGNDDLFADPWAEPQPTRGRRVAEPVAVVVEPAWAETADPAAAGTVEATPAGTAEPAHAATAEPALAATAEPAYEGIRELVPPASRLARPDLAEQSEEARAMRAATRRRRFRIGALVGGLTLLVAAGGALLPGAVQSIAAVPARPASNAAQQAVPTAVSPVSPDIPEQARAVPPAGEPAPVPDAGPDPVADERPPGSALTPISALAAPKVAGIPQPCPIDVVITDDMSASQITERAGRQWGFELTGPQWHQDNFRPIVKLFAETLDSVDCTGYLDRVKAGNGGQLEISSLPTRSWAWGDYGLTRPNVLTLDFAKFREGYADGDRGRLTRLIIHEMAHSLNADRFGEPKYWSAFHRVWAANGPVSAYGTTETESFADAVGYFVARCAADNPYETRQHTAYYDYVRTHIFDGREFGGPVGTQQNCAIKGR